MDTSAVPDTTMPRAASSQPLQTILEAQVTMMRELAESQEQVARMLAESGLGQTIDIKA